MECAIVECTMFYSYCNWYGQEDFTWQKIWRTSTHLFNVRWNNHLVSYFSLYCYGINSHKCIAFNIFSCRILIISYKMLLNTEISDETRNELTIYATLCRNVTIFYRQKLASLFQVQEKLKKCRNSKRNF